MKVGFIGLGGMGLAIARNLLQAGHEVTVYNRTRSRADELRGDGAQVAETAAGACGGDVLMSMLSDDRAFEDIFFGSGNNPGNVISALRPKAIHVCMSTISVAMSQRLKQAHAAAGHRYVAAPVFGRPDAAAAKKLFTVVGGPADAVEQCRPLFDAIGQKTFVLGEDAVAATVLKITGNFLIASVIESLGEAFALLRKSGCDPQQFLEIMTSTVFPSPVFKNYGGMIASQRYEPAGFKLRLGLKDIRLTLEAAEACTVPMPIASIVRDHFLSAMARGYQDQDWGALARVSAEDAGLKQ